MSEMSDRLKNECNILDVVKVLCHPVIKKGDAYFFHCPNPNHQDKHASCYTKDGWNNVYCNSCGHYATAIDLIQEITGYSFPEACDYLAEIMGSPSWYRFNKRPDTDNDSLTYKELNLLGLREVQKIVSKKQFIIMAQSSINRLKTRYELLSMDCKDLEMIANKIKKLSS